MERIFEIASNISTPLGLAGFFFACLFFIIYRLIRNAGRKREIKNSIDPSVIDTDDVKELPVVNYSPEENHKEQIIKYLYRLSFVAMFLGFSGFIFTKVYEPVKDDKILIQGIVFVDGKETANVEVKVLEVEKLDQTNYFGKFRIIFSSSDKEDVYNLSFKSQRIRDTVIEIKNDSLPKKYFFNSIPLTDSDNKRKLLNSTTKGDFNEYTSVSIQLSKETKGYKRVLVNGVEATLLAESTMFNPRIQMLVNVKKSQEIIIITNTLDTCRINQIFAKQRSDSFFRIVPKCNNG